jgi:FMN phosphatase YigB (HAD superfamily)
VSIQTVFLDAGGVLVNPNWSRVSETLARHGVAVSAATLAEAEPRAKKRLDTGETIQATNDEQRGWTYFNLVLTEAGVALSDKTADALAELHRYHQEFNLWEVVPDEVWTTLSALRARGLRLAVVSNDRSRRRPVSRRRRRRASGRHRTGAARRGGSVPRLRLHARAVAVRTG